MNLYEINKDLQKQLLNSVDEDGCIIEGMESAIDSLFEAKQDKLLNCAKYIKNETANAEMIKKEELNLARRRKSIENRIEWMKKYMLSNMEEGETVADSQASVSTRKSTAVHIVDQNLLPPECLRIIPQSITADKSIIAKMLKSGEVSGAEIVTNINLNIK